VSLLAPCSATVSKILVSLAIPSHQYTSKALSSAPIEVFIRSHGLETLGPDVLWEESHTFLGRIDRLVFSLFGLMVFILTLPHQLLSVNPHDDYVIGSLAGLTAGAILILAVQGALLWTPLALGAVNILLAHFSLRSFVRATFMAPFTYLSVLIVVFVANLKPEYGGGVSNETCIIVETVWLVGLPFVFGIGMRFLKYYNTILQRQRDGFL